MAVKDTSQERHPTPRPPKSWSEHFRSRTKSQNNRNSIIEGLSGANLHEACASTKFRGKARLVSASASSSANKPASLQGFTVARPAQPAAVTGIAAKARPIPRSDPFGAERFERSRAKTPQGYARAFNSISRELIGLSLTRKQQDEVRAQRPKLKPFWQGRWLMPRGWLGRHLDSGRVLIMIDGLDEVPYRHCGFEKVVLFRNSRARTGTSAIACRQKPEWNLEPVSSRGILNLVIARYLPAIFPMRSPTQIDPQSELLCPATASGHP